MFLTNILAGTLGLLWALVSIAYILFQIVFSYIAYGYYFGIWAAIFIVVFCLLLRFTFPLAIGLFMGLRIYFGLEWYFALLISFPSILFLFPSSIALIIATIRDTFNSDEESTFNNQIYENTFDGENEKIIKSPPKMKVSKPRKFKKGDLITSWYDLTTGNAFKNESEKKRKGVGEVLGIIKNKEKRGNRFVNVEYYEVKFGRKTIHIKVSQQKSYKLKKIKN